MSAILELLKLAIVGLVSGFFSYYLSGRKHRTEKWWELRVSAYKEVIAALSDLYYYFEHHLKIEETGGELTEKRKKELQRFWDDGYHKVRKAADAGAFLFSAEAEDALKKFIKDETDYDTYYDYVDSRCADAKKCLDALVTCSKKDLRLKDSFFIK